MSGLTQDQCDELFAATSVDFNSSGPEWAAVLETVRHIAAAARAEGAEKARAEGAGDAANAFMSWAAKNEIAEPPLDWAWFGEIARRYSPLYEGNES